MVVGIILQDYHTKQSMDTGTFRYKATTSNNSGMPMVLDTANHSDP
jgi:hypothetical protein